MAEQDPNMMTPEDGTENQEPFIPPRYLLILSGLGFVIAVVVLLTQSTFSVVGFGGLAFGILALIAWVLIAPREASAALSGRSLRYGGASILVTILVLVALAVVYIVVRGADLRYDLTQSNEFSLTDESLNAMQSLGVDPNVPNVQILAFYGPSQAGSRDRDSLLLQQYVDASGGKISYEFVDPDQRFDLVDTYSISRPGSLAVVPLGTDGTPDTQNAETVTSLNQEQLTNAILKVAAQGDFIAYFLTPQNGISSDMSVVKQYLTTVFDWTVRDISLLQLTAPEGEFQLGDDARDGEVVVVPGGTGAFTDEELQILEDYLNQGGDIIVFADSSFQTDGAPLATDTNFNEYLLTNFGIHMNNDIVIDQVQAYQSPLIPLVTTFDRQNFVSSNGVPSTNAIGLAFTPHSITVADELPANVTVSRLMQTSSDSYVKSDMEALLAAQESNDAFAAAIQKTDDDEAGPVTIAAAAENSQTGAHVVLFGSLFGRDDVVASQQIVNFEVSLNSFFWTTNFNDFFQTITVQQQQRPQDTPIFASQQTLRDIGFWTQWVLPFGILALGGLVLWMNRERRAQ